MGKTNLPKTDTNMENANYTTIIVSIFVLILTIVFYVIYRRRKEAKRGILLVGLSDSGKTLIFSQLLHSKYVQTQTSIKENIGEYIVNTDSLRIVDIPGHERLRYKFLDQYKSIARGIIFVIDSTTLQKDIRDVAENLYVILSDPTITSIKSKILIVCNKQDQIMAKGSSVIKGLLEKEINTLRVTKSSQLESIDKSTSNNIYLGKQDKEFEFTQLPLNIEFAESRAFVKESDGRPVDLKAVKQWIENII